jgi:hypothetical protein
VPCVKLKFPFAYGDKVAGNFSGIQESATSKIPITGKYEVVADAYGTLLLPGSVIINNALRVKQTRITGNVSEITYRWYTDNLRYPVLVIIKYITPKETHIAETALYAHLGDRNKNATSVNDLEPVSSFSAYPSPYHEQLKVSYELEKDGNVQIELFDMSGRLTKSILGKTKQSAGYHDISVTTDERSLMPGIYYVRLTLDNKTFVRKVVKQ